MAFEAGRMLDTGPTMLKALEELLSNERRRSTLDSRSAQKPPLVRDAMDDARTAIAKAKGTTVATPDLATLLWRLSYAYDPSHEQYHPRRLHRDDVQPPCRERRLHPDRSAVPGAVSLPRRAEGRQRRQFAVAQTVFRRDVPAAEAGIVLASSFYGWNTADLFFDAWKQRASTSWGTLFSENTMRHPRGFYEYRHESAYLLAKGDVTPPAKPLARRSRLARIRAIGSTRPGNPWNALTPIIAAFCKPGDVVLDPFCGSGSTLVAARDVGCAYLGIELDLTHHRTARERLRGVDFQPPVDEIEIAVWPRPFTRYVEAVS